MGFKMAEQLHCVTVFLQNICIIHVPKKKSHTIINFTYRSKDYLQD